MVTPSGDIQRRIIEPGLILPPWRERRRPRRSWQQTPAGIWHCATPSVDNSGQTVVGTGVSTRTITAFAVGAGSNRLLIAAAMWWSSTDRTVSSAVFNTSETLTQLDTHSQSIFGGTQRVTVLYLKNPSNTTANVVITASGSVDEAICGAFSLADVDLTSTFGTVAKNQSTSIPTNATVTVSSSADAYVFDFGACGDDSGNAPTATGTQHWNLNNANDNTRGFCQRKNGGASITMNWTGDHMGGFVTMGVGINGITAGATGNPWYAYAQQ